MHRLTYEQISVLLPLWEVKYCLWWTHTCFIFHRSVLLEFLECFGPPACSQNTDGIHCHTQTGSYRNGWWIGHSSSSETFAQDVLLRLYCFFNCRFSCWWHLASHLTVFSASCTVFKILRQVKNRASVTSVHLEKVIRRNWGWEIWWYSPFLIISHICMYFAIRFFWGGGYFIFHKTFVNRSLLDVKRTFSRCFDLECMWICSFYSRLHIIISSNPFNRCLVLTEIFISTSGDHMDPNRSLFFSLWSCSPL